MSTTAWAPSRSVDRDKLLRRVIAFDAAANVVGAAALWAGSSGWTSAFGRLGSPRVVVALGVLFLINGVECWMTARRPLMPARSLWALAAVDLIFGAAALLFAVTNPTGAETWGRWAAASAGDAAVVVGAIKGYGAYRTRLSAGDALATAAESSRA